MEIKTKALGLFFPFIAPGITYICIYFSFLLCSTLKSPISPIFFQFVLLPLPKVLTRVLLHLSAQCWLFRFLSSFLLKQFYSSCSSRLQAHFRTGYKINSAFFPALLLGLDCTYLEHQNSKISGLVYTHPKRLWTEAQQEEDSVCTVARQTPSWLVDHGREAAGT